MTNIKKSKFLYTLISISACFPCMLSFILVLFSTNLPAQRITFSSDFEQWENNLPSGWMGSATNIAAENVQMITGDVPSGEKACRLINTDLLTCLFSSRKFRVDRAYDYNLSFHFKGKAAGNVLIKLYNNDTLVKTICSFLASRETWIEVSRPFENSHTLENAELVFEVGQTSGDFGHLCLDNLEIVKTRAVLGLNNVGAKVNFDGALFEDRDFNKGFEIAVRHYSGSMLGVTTVRSSGFLIGGINRANQSLSLTGEAYRFYSMFSNGPIATNYDEFYESKYGYVWHLTQSEINYHRQNCQSAYYVPIYSIASWPGNGNTENGEQQFLAPYADVNQNNIYDPLQGDYPIIRGDEAVFYIMNDDRIQAQGDFNSMGIEIHGMLYAYNNSADSALHNTVFLHQKIFNLSQSTYDNVYIGKLTDMVILHEDGYGTDSLRNSVYSYVKSAGDGHSFGFPSQGMVLLNHSLSSSVLSSSPNMNDYNGTPVNNTEWYNYLKGFWRNGSPITYGGTGFDGLAATTMMFTGYPETNVGWIQPNIEDKLSVISTGINTLNPGNFICFDMAFPYAEVPANYDNYAESVGQLRRFTDRIQEFYNSQNYACEIQTVDIPTLTSVETPVQVYPNPNNGIFTVSLPDDFYANFEIEIYNPLGQQIFHREKLKSLEQVNLKNYSGFGIYVIKRDNEVISRGVLSINR